MKLSKLKLPILTKRERIISIIFVVVVIIGTSYKFLFLPQITAIQSLEDRISQSKIKKMQVQLEANPNNKIYENYATLNQKINEETSHFFPSIIQEQLILLLNEKLGKSLISQADIAFSQIQSSEIVIGKKEVIQPPTYLEQFVDKSKKASVQQAETPAPVPNDQQKLNKITTTLTFSSTYMQLQALIQTIESDKRKIVINNVNTAKQDKSSGDIPILFSTISLDFYALPKPYTQDLDYLQWVIHNEYGKINPFSSSTGRTPETSTPDTTRTSTPDTTRTLENSTTNSIPTTAEENSDFFLIAKPIQSDMPTVLLGKANDKEGTSYLEADSEGVKDAQLYVYEKNKKYYYELKVAGKSYPTSHKSVRFTPLSKKMMFNIFSSARLDATDLSGVNLSIINKTTLPLQVIVTDDDTKNPRVKFMSKLGNIEVVH